MEGLIPKRNRVQTRLLITKGFIPRKKTVSLIFLRAIEEIAVCKYIRKYIITNFATHR